MSIADCSSMQPDLFTSPSKALLSQSSCSSDTGEFFREAKERLSIYSYDPYSNLYAAAGNIPSEDEVPFSFGSADSSRHSLLVLMSPTHHDDREGRGHSDYSVSSCDSSAESAGKGEKKVQRQRRIESFGEATVNIQCGDSFGQDLSSTLKAVDDEGCTPKENSSLEHIGEIEATHGSGSGSADADLSKQPKKPQRRERRCAVTSYMPSPLDVQHLDENTSSDVRLQEEDKLVSEAVESMDDKVSTPRQRKTYSVKDRLLNPLNVIQIELCVDGGKANESVSTQSWEQEEGLSSGRLPRIDVEESCDSLEMYPNPPASPRLSVHEEGSFLEDKGIDMEDIEGSSVSMDYPRQGQVEDSRPTCGRGYGGKGGVVGEGDAISSLLDKYPNLARYSTSSLQAMSQLVSRRRSNSWKISDSRKMSDSVVVTKRDQTPPTHPRQRSRCVSDPVGPRLDDDRGSEVGSWSHPYCDSGYNDEKSSRCHGSNSSAYIPSPRVSLFSSDLLSQDEGVEGSYQVHSKPHRRLTPYTSSCHLKEEGGVCQDEPPSLASTGQTGSSGTMVRPRERSRRSNVKNYSQSSLGASSAGTGASSETMSLTSLFESPSPLTVEDILSNLGFDDFNSPQLIPDHFIPKDIEHAKPSVMRTMTTSEYVLHDSPSNSHYSSYEPSIASTSYSAPIPYSHHHMTHSHSTASLPGSYALACMNADSAITNEAPPTPHNANNPHGGDLPLGATAENFLASRSGSPPPSAQSSKVPPEREVQQRNADARFPATSTMAVGFHRGRLETVPEETASDLSPSPRWLSPRVSIDHSVNFDIAEGKLGASLNVQKVRKRSLPTQREGYKLSVGSLVESDTGGDSIHFSVTSYDDEIAAEREKEREDTLLQLPFEDSTIPQQQHRRRRRGVYTPPPALLSWLSQQQPIHEEDVGDPDELPWPFNEQARLRKSLTEIQLAQMALCSEGPLSETRDGALESQCSSGSSKADGCCSISSSPPSSIPRSSPGPGEDGSPEGNEEVSSKLTNDSLPQRRRHSRDNSTSTQQANHKTRSLSCQSDYHLLRRELDTAGLTNHGTVGGGEDKLLRIEIEELRYTMSATQRRLSRALALKGEQCKQLQEVANQT